MSIPPVFGPLIAVTKAVGRAVQLPGQIAEWQEEVSIPLMERAPRRSGRRFTFVKSILEASLLERLESCKNQAERRVLIQRYVREVREEFNMNKPMLQKQHATRADVALLSMALQEIALCLDEHVAEFKRQGNRQVKVFQEQAAAALRQAEITTANATSTLAEAEKAFEQKRQEVSSQFQRHSDAQIKDFEQKAAACLREANVTTANAARALTAAESSHEHTRREATARAEEVSATLLTQLRRLEANQLTQESRLRFVSLAVLIVTVAVVVFRL